MIKKVLEYLHYLNKLKQHPEKFTELFKLVANENERKVVEKIINVKLPNEFKQVTNNATGITGKQAWGYLKNRGLTMDDVKKYNLGYCEYGNYKNMIIIPSYDGSGYLNFFTGRSFEKDPYRKYRNPEASRDIIPFELFINWKLPLVLCEGPFDAIAINVMLTLQLTVRKLSWHKVLTVLGMHILLMARKQPQSTKTTMKLKTEKAQTMVVGVKTILL